MGRRDGRKGAARPRPTTEGIHAMKGKQSSPPVPLAERVGRAIIADAQGQYTEAERARVREALENRPEDLARVIAEIHGAHEKGDGQ
jgi:hypothetical protein